MVRYIILKDGYDTTDPQMRGYHYLNNNGIRVYNTEEYILDNYNINFEEIDRRIELLKTELMQTDDMRECDKIQERVTKLACLLYTSPSPRDRTRSRMPSSA